MELYVYNPNKTLRVLMTDDDPDAEEPLVHFSVEHKDGSGWETIEDSAYYMDVPAATTPRKELLRLGHVVLRTVAGTIRRKGSVKRQCEILSWLMVGSTTRRFKGFNDALVVKDGKSYPFAVRQPWRKAQ